MASIGTLNWAEEKVDEIFRRYEHYLCKAYTLQIDVIEVAGKENLKSLSQELDEALSIIANHKGPFGKTDAHEHAEILRDDLDSVLSGLK